MDPQSIVDAQFNRAVEIVQNLPKTGPIQTGYEDKLDMYSLFKQATMGNVQGPRPSLWEMLPRAKWDAWAKHKDLDPYQAKSMYVEALLKVLRRYSDKTIAMDYVRELGTYAIDSSDLVLSGSFSNSRASSSSSSGSSHAGPSGSHYSEGMHPYGHAISADYQSMSYRQASQPNVDTGPESLTSEEEDAGERADEVRSRMIAPPSVYAQATRPQSSLSHRRYRTPMASGMSSPPPVSSSVPPVQPMPRYETSSAYAEMSAAPPSTSGVVVSYPPSASQYSRIEATTSPRLPLQPPYRSASLQQSEYTGRPYALSNPVTARIALERAIENVQTHLAALTERMDSLETRAHRSSSSLVSPSGVRSPRWLGSSRGLSPLGYPHEPYTFEEMGMWSLILN
ncbi:hypothetical protein PHLGIDRAFT_103187, partial [Phlebiopsis gigantea 11061_1 CR5-6]